MVAPRLTTGLRRGKKKRADVSIRAFCKSLPSRRLNIGGQLDIDRAFLLTQGPAQFRERDVLQLADAFPRHPKLLADFFERLRFASVETEAGENNLPFAIIEHIEQSADFVAQVLVPQQFEWCLCFFVANNLAELGRIIVTDRRVE